MSQEALQDVQEDVATNGDNSPEVEEDSENVEKVSVPETDEKQNSEEGDSEDDTPDVEVENAAEVEKEPSEVEKIKSAMQKRIDRQSAANRALTDKVEQLTRELEQSKPQQADNAPNEEDFESFEEYNQALVEYKANKKFETMLNEQKKRELAEAEDKKMENDRKVFESKEHEFRSHTPDYDDKATAFQEIANDLVRQRGAQDVTLNALGQFIIDSDVAPQIIYELGSNPDLMEEIASKTPIQAARELFKIETLVSAKKQTETKKDVPEPIKKPLKGNGKANKDLSKMSGKELMKHFNLG